MEGATATSDVETIVEGLLEKELEEKQAGTVTFREVETETSGARVQPKKVKEVATEPTDGTISRALYTQLEQTYKVLCVKSDAIGKENMEGIEKETVAEIELHSDPAGILELTTEGLVGIIEIRDSGNSEITEYEENVQDQGSGTVGCFKRSRRKRS